jgi:hypothetical protein
MRAKKNEENKVSSGHGGNKTDSSTASSSGFLSKILNVVLVCMFKPGINKAK